MALSKSHSTIIRRTLHYPNMVDAEEYHQCRSLMKNSFTLSIAKEFFNPQLQQRDR